MQNDFCNPFPEGRQMANAYPNLFVHHNIAQAVEAFIAGTIPAMLGPLASRISARHPRVRRLGVLSANKDGTLLDHWSDSDGRVTTCPDSIARLDENPALFESHRAMAPSSDHLGLDPLLAWITRDGGSALLVCPIGSRHHFVGFLVFEGLVRDTNDQTMLSELQDWSPIVADRIRDGIGAVHSLVGSIMIAHDFVLLRDHQTGCHQGRMSVYLHILAREMTRAHGLPDGFADELAVFGSLHDIGKIGIADAILLKPGAFDCLDWERMKEHVVIGRDMISKMRAELRLNDAPGMATLEAVVGQHHEAIDGSGYPDGLTGDEIALVARMVTTVDIFDALTCTRPYKRPWSLDEAFAHLDNLAGVKIDKECVAALHSARAEIAQAWQDHANAEH